MALVTMDSYSRVVASCTSCVEARLAVTGSNDVACVCSCSAEQKTGYAIHM